MRILLTICGFHIQLRNPQQLNLTKQFTYYLFVDSTSCSGFRKYGCSFRKIAYFWSDFERFSLLGICLWNPKQRKRSKKSSNNADSATNMILACCGIRLKWTECTVWPRNEICKKYSKRWLFHSAVNHKVQCSMKFGSWEKSYNSLLFWFIVVFKMEHRTRLMRKI